MDHVSLYEFRISFGKVYRGPTVYKPKYRPRYVFLRRAASLPVGNKPTQACRPTLKLILFRPSNLKLRGKILDLTSKVNSPFWFRNFCVTTLCHNKMIGLIYPDFGPAPPENVSNLGLLAVRSKTCHFCFYQPRHVGPNLYTSIG